MTIEVEGTYNEVEISIDTMEFGGKTHSSSSVCLTTSEARKLIEDISNMLGIESRFEKAVPMIETALRDRHPTTKVFEEDFIQQIEYAPYSFLMDELTDTDFVLLMYIKFDGNDECCGAVFRDFENIEQVNAVFEPVHGLLIFIKDKEP